MGDSCKELERELEDFQNEREKLKRVIGRIGGNHNSVKHRLVNIAFLVVVVVVFFLGAIFHKITMTFSLEIGVLLISLKNCLDDT